MRRIHTDQTQESFNGALTVFNAHYFPTGANTTNFQI